jgi:hypothetical protein
MTPVLGFVVVRGRVRYDTYYPGKHLTIAAPVSTQGDEYYEMVDEFMHAVFSRWPDVVVQFEDFESQKAIKLLEKVISLP